MPHLVATNRAELMDYEKRVITSADVAISRLIASPERGIDLLARIKFEPIGRHPTEDRDLNLIEQVNQTFTYLSTLRATKILFDLHPEILAGFRLNLGTQSGSDIESVEHGLVAAEVFAATSPNSNQKLKKDIRKVDGIEVEHRYVFFNSPGYSPGRQHDLEISERVQVWVVGGFS